MGWGDRCRLPFPSAAQNKAAADDNFAVKYYFSFISEQQTSADGSAIKSFKRYFPVQSFFPLEALFFCLFCRLGKLQRTVNKLYFSNLVFPSAVRCRRSSGIQKQPTAFFRT